MAVTLEAIGAVLGAALRDATDHSWNKRLHDLLRLHNFEVDRDACRDEYIIGRRVPNTCFVFEYRVSAERWVLGIDPEVLVGEAINAYEAELDKHGLRGKETP